MKTNTVDSEYELAAAVDTCAALIALGKAARNYALAEAGTPLEEVVMEEGPIRVSLMKTDGRARDHVPALANFSPLTWAVVQVESSGSFDTTSDLVKLLQKLDGYELIEAGALLPSTDRAMSACSKALVRLATFRAMGLTTTDPIFQSVGN